MDTIKIKDNSFVYSYKGGLKTAFCRDLVAIECDKPFIWLVFNNEKVLVRASLTAVETQLQNYFIRVSRQVIVNMHHVSELLFKNGSYWLLLTKGAEYKVSERREKAVRAAFFCLRYKECVQHHKSCVRELKLKFV